MTTQAPPDISGPNPIQRLCLQDGRAFERKARWPMPSHSKVPMADIPCTVLAINFVGEDEENNIPSHYEVIGRPIDGSPWAQARKTVTAMVFLMAVATVEYKEDWEDAYKTAIRRVEETKEAMGESVDAPPANSGGAPS